MLMVNLLCSWADILQGGIEVGCDGLSALNKAFDSWTLEPTDPHFNMLSALCYMITASPLRWTQHHIEGHQDDDATATLDFWALQNIKMDNLPNIFWIEHSATAPVLYPIAGEGFQVWLGDRKLAPAIHRCSLTTFTEKTILDWHSSHNRFPACYARHINWEVCGAALRRLPMGQRRWVSKHTSLFCGVGTKMVQWKEQLTPACPRCGDSEHVRHVWLCQDPAVFCLWALLMSSFSE
jgi:hypothetical protein